MPIYLQVAKGDIGKSMVSGEFVSMTAMHKTIPDATPASIAWGTYASNPDIHFFLCYFVDMTDEVPDVQAFTTKVAALHTNGISPTGKYGFPVPTYMGQMPQYTAWTDSWEAFFTVSMERLMLVIEEIQGPDPDLRRSLGADYRLGDSSTSSAARDRRQADCTSSDSWRPLFW